MGNVHVPAEMLEVSRVLIIFQACGVKLVIDAAVAAALSTGWMSRFIPAGLGYPAYRRFKQC
jgi:hypothetical protein